MGMKEKELRKAATCAVCGEPFGKAGMPMFWRVKIERIGLDAQAIHRQAGFETFLGSVQLAQVMGPNKEMTKPLIDPVTVTICEKCIINPIIIPSLVEK